MLPDGALGSPWHSDMMHITDESPEVSLWYSLTKTTVKGGGGIAVAVGSHKWYDPEHPNNKCFWRVDKTTHIYNTLTQDDIDACNVLLESLRYNIETEPGDVIVWDRWLMHRTVPFDPSNDPLTQTQVPRIAYNVRLASDSAVFKLPDFLCSGRPRWEWYQDWDNAVEGEPVTGAFMPQIYPTSLDEEKNISLDVTGTGMTRKSFSKMLFEFMLYKPIMCKIPERIGVKKSEHEHHQITIVNEGIYLKVQAKIQGVVDWIKR
jgi:hypothetical protein